ncbi:hypothetical protein GW17_00010021 [Ensete ventricosum]|nr:hypothetical protein GW17_00010021 [Ensete ventricosum]
MSRFSHTHTHTQPAYTSIRKTKRSRKWIPLRSAGGEGMDHVTLGVGCAFFGIMIGHIQVWLARHVIPPFSRPNADVPPSPHAKLSEEDAVRELMRARTPGLGSATELTFFTSLDRDNLNIAHVLWRYRVGYAAVSDSVFSLGS